MGLFAPRFAPTPIRIFEALPQKLKNRNEKRPDFEEVCIQLKLKHAPMPPGQLNGLLAPDQMMADEVSELIAKGRAR